MRAAQRTGIQIVGIDVFSKVDDSCDFVRLFPSGSFVLVSATKGCCRGWEFKIMEIEVVEFSLASAVGLKGPDHIDGRVMSGVFFIEFEVLSHFLSLSQVPWLIELILVAVAVDYFESDFLLLLLRLRFFTALLGWLLHVVVNLGLADETDRSSRDFLLSSWFRRLQDRRLLRRDLCHCGSRLIWRVGGPLRLGRLVD